MTPLISRPTWRFHGCFFCVTVSNGEVPREVVFKGFKTEGGQLEKLLKVMRGGDVVSDLCPLPKPPGGTSDSRSRRESSESAPGGGNGD